MTNREANGYRSIPLSNTHIHLIYPKEADTTVSIFRNFLKYFEYESMTLCAMTRSGHRVFDPTNNLKALYCKSVLNAERANSIYVYGSTVHFYDERDTADCYLRQVKELYDMGADGYKLLDGKPEFRKNLGKPLCDPIFDPMYSFIEEKGMPVKMHLGDPAYFWGPKENLTPYEISRGWYYGDGTFPSREALYDEVYEILTKFPKLKLCLAHFGFMDDDLARATDFFKRFENASLDLTPHSSMFVRFRERREEWLPFFERYANRIFFGSDTYNYISVFDTDGTYEHSGDLANVVRRMLEYPEEHTVEHPDLGTMVPIDLPDRVLEKIYFKNQRNLLGDARPLHAEKIVVSAKKLVGDIENGACVFSPEEEKVLELANLDTIIKYFQKR